VEDAEQSIIDTFRIERERSELQVDEATAYLFDNIEFFAMTYPGALGLRELAMEYATTSRLVWISNRSLARKVELLQSLSAPIEVIFFGYWWKRVHLLNLMSDFKDKVIEVQE